MQLADHIRSLLRDHDCVIIPDFGGLVADVSPARAQPGRQTLSPPTKLVAFNQALTRNDGLLVDALSQHTGLPIGQAREVVRTAVASLQQELAETNRTELPGIGIFRRATGRGLAFEYTGTDNLLASAFGLPELAARPVRVGEARVNRAQPALRGATTRRTRWARLAPAGIIAVAASLLVLVNIQVMQNVGYLPASWQAKLPSLDWSGPRPTPSAGVDKPQLATLGQHTFATNSLPTEGITPLPEAASASTVEAALPVETPVRPAVTTTPASPLTGAIEDEATTLPAATAGATTSKVAATPAPKTAAKPAASTAPAAKAPAGASVVKSTTIKSRTGRFYVIAGAYSTMAGAEVGRRNLAHRGHDAHIIPPFYGTRHYRVTVAAYPDLASAQREARRLRVSRHSAKAFDTFKY